MAAPESMRMSSWSVWAFCPTERIQPGPHAALVLLRVIPKQRSRAGRCWLLGPLDRGSAARIGVSLFGPTVAFYVPVLLAPVAVAVKRLGLGLAHRGSCLCLP